MRVIIDLVVNHTSDQHPWFQSARSRPEVVLPRLVRLVGQEAARAPTRAWCSRACRRATWSYDRQAKAWYFHRFYEFQPDLDTSNPEVQAEILKIMGFWIQLGVAGFRMDAVPFVISEKGPDVTEPVLALRHAAQLPRVRAVAAGRRDDPGRGQRAAGHGPGVFRQGRRPHAHDVQFPGQPEPVLRDGGRRHRAPRPGPEGDEAAARHRAVGHLPAQPRRARPRPAHRRAAAAGLRRLRPRPVDAALRARHPAPAGTDAGRRPPPARARLQPDVHPAGHARDPLRRRDRDGRRPLAARAELRPDADAVVDRAAGRLHQGRQAGAAGDQRAALTATSTSTSPSSAATRTRSSTGPSA